MEIDIQLDTPPSKVFTDRGGSKYDIAIQTALNSRGNWFRVSSVPVEKRNSIYSTASAIRNGRLGNVPEGVNIQLICRRVEDEVVMFIKAL